VQACLEHSTLPLLEPDSLPLVEVDPAWAIPVSRPVNPDRHEFAQVLRGVPKAALRHVFGNALGTRLWRQNRAASTTAGPTPARGISPILPISDSEISGAMLRYLCNEAAATLREHKRLAKSISLTVSYSDGESENAREHLLVASNDAASLETAARLALRGARSRSFVSLKLNLTATPAQA